MSMNELRDLCVKMKSLQAEKVEIEEKLKVVADKLDYHRLKLIPDLMMNMELKNATFDGVGRVQLASDLYASTREGQKQAAMQWLRDCGYGDMITETYNASSIKALFRRQMAEGIDIPDTLFNVLPFIRASVVNK